MAHRSESGMIQAAAAEVFQQIVRAQVTLLPLSLNERVVR